MTSFNDCGSVVLHDLCEETFDKIEDWCTESIGAYNKAWYHEWCYLGTWRYFFKNKQDLILFKLTWQ